MKVQIRNLLTLFLLGAFAAVFAFGQAETGQLTGVVTDPSGAVVVNAKVTATNTGTGLVRTAQTGSNGSYTFTNLQPATYDVLIEGTGFAPMKRRVDVAVGGRSTVDAQLKVTGAGTTVEVNAETVTQVNTQSQELSQVVTQTQIQQLPTLTRDPYNLVTISGNVSEGGDSQMGRGVNVAINGQRAAGTDILLDGGENVDLFGASVGQNIPLDAVQEFRVITNNYSSEYGRASGGIVNVTTRSGTNVFHGSVYEFSRLSALASRTYEEDAENFDARANGNPETPKARFTRNQFGYFIGGPVIKDKIFFSSGTEWTRVRSDANLFALVPTAQFLALTAPNTQQFFNQFGKLAATPTGQVVRLSDIGIDKTTSTPGGISAQGLAKVGSTPVFQKVQYTVPANSGGAQPQNTYSTVNRVDYNLSDKTTLYGRYGLESQNLFAGTNASSPYDGFNTGSTNYNQNALLNVTHVFSPTVVAQSKIVFNRLNNQQPFGQQPAGPTLYLFKGNTASTVNNTKVALPGYLPFSPGNAIPFGGPQNLYQFYQDVSITRGAHTLRFGGDFIHTRDNRVFGAYEGSVEQLGNGKSGLGIDALLNGQLFSFQGAVFPQGKFPCPTNASGTTLQSSACTLTLPVGPPSFSRNNRFNDGAVYGQDTWKVDTKLTLNLGLRWEYYGVQHNADPTLESNFFFGSGNTFFDQVRNGQVLTTPNSPKGGLIGQSFKNFAPRIGFAYDPFGNGKWSVRGGYGVSYERNFGNVTYNVIQNPPNYAVISLTANTSDTNGQPIPITTNNAGPLAGTGTKALPKTSLRAVDPNIDTAYSHQYSLAIEHEVVKNTLVSLEFAGSRGIHQYGISNINGTFFGNVFMNDANLGNRLNYQYSNINFRDSHGDSYYNGLNVKLQSSNFRDMGLQFVANYTWSHAIDDLSSTFSESNNNFNLGYLNFTNPGLDRGNADFDLRHRLVFSAIYEPTFLSFKNSSKLLQNAFGGWEFAPIFKIRSGSPFTIYDCSNSFALCPRAIDAAGFSRTGDSKSNGDVNSYDYITIPAAAANPYIGPSVALANAAIAAGGSGAADLPTCTSQGCVLPAGLQRNSFFGPKNWNLDMGLYKNIKVTERVGMQFRGEFFNILNHHNFYVDGSTADVAEVSAVQTKKGVNFSDSSLDERRNIQLGLKITF
jgi:outer membrane receptor protein involved in Fe transport